MNDAALNMRRIRLQMSSMTRCHHGRGTDYGCCCCWGDCTGPRACTARILAWLSARWAWILYLLPRITVVALCSLIAALLPEFELVISFVGSLGMDVLISVQEAFDMESTPFAHKKSLT